MNITCVWPVGQLFILVGYLLYYSSSMTDYWQWRAESGSGGRRNIASVRGRIVASEGGMNLATWACE